MEITLNAAGAPSCGQDRLNEIAICPIDGQLLTFLNVTLPEILPFSGLYDKLFSLHPVIINNNTKY